MTAEVNEAKGLGVFERIFGIFTSPKETFQDINNKPNWLVPFLVLIAVVIVVQFMLLDIGLADQLARLEAREMPEAQMEIARTQMQGPLKYIQFAVIPIMTLLTWCIVSGIHLFFTNVVFGGETTFKKMFAVISWSSLIGIISTVLRMIMVMSKGTSYGVTTSLAILMPTPGLGETPSILFRLLAHLDIFAIWGLVLFAIGISKISKLDINKSASVVIINWLIWVMISVPLWSVFGAFVVGY
ncbi:YIP1 family protein [bacterium]|nr:YIP1 family protein [candidate division CSSED10-310 bacterium]